MPISRASRERVSWYGDIDLIPHLIGVLRSGAIDVVASWGEPVAYGVDADRKEIARNAEWAVRRMTASALRSAPPANAPDDEIEGVPAAI
jgi:1-acyl-sn-glycerol-3-phosphate acyltransferase